MVPAIGASLKTSIGSVSNFLWDGDLYHSALLGEAAVEVTAVVDGSSELGLVALRDCFGGFDEAFQVGLPDSALSVDEAQVMRDAACHQLLLDVVWDLDVFGSPHADGDHGVQPVLESRPQQLQTPVAARLLHCRVYTVLYKEDYDVISVLRSKYYQLTFYHAGWVMCIL